MRRDTEHQPPWPVNRMAPLHPAERVTDNIERPSVDNRTYRVVRLQNKLEALIVHDPDTDKASAAMDVNVGAFSDEDDMPGMAHAVEHLLFMGTKKYPVENAYSQYLSANSGSSNAYTGSTSTNYYFEVAGKPSDDGEASAENPSPLYGAMDRFAQFFIEPLFLESTLDRELQAVDSENKKNLQSDVWRFHQLVKSLSNPKHPYCHFSTGNFEVLKTAPEARGINVRDKFIEFYNKHYSANLMKLVVLGREPLDVLESWVIELFSDIPNKNLPQNRWEDEDPFGPEQLGTQIFTKPVMDSRELNLFFPFMDQESHYETQPSRYISHLIGHEGPGSIMSYIKTMGWANGLSAGAYPICAGSPGIFDCQVRLTEEGLKHYKEIVKAFFQYVSLLRETPPQDWIFKEQQEMTDVEFKFKQKTPASKFASKTSSVMQSEVPREWLLSYPKLRKFDPELIKQGIDMLRPENLRLTLSSREFPGDWDQKEKWYGTEYKYERIPSDFMEELKQAASVSPQQRIRHLHLPHKNMFIPTKLDVEKKEVKEPAIGPRLIRNDDLARTWYKKDDRFWIPKAALVVSCKTPLIHASAQNYVRARLYTDLVKDALEEYAYDAEIAGLNYAVSLDAAGLAIQIAGYNDKLPVLMERVLLTVRDLEIKEERFNIVKERTSRAYRNWAFQQPYHQITDYSGWLMSEVDFLIEDIATELPIATIDTVRSFHKEMISQMHMECYALGNLYKEDVLRLTDMVEKTLRPRVLPKSQWPITRQLIFPPGSNYTYETPLKDPKNVNHCIDYLLYIGDIDDMATKPLRAQTLLLDQMAREPTFDQLRTKEQLGYVVFSGIKSTPTTYSFRFIIQSEKKPSYLESRIEFFLIQFGKNLEEMSDEEFESHKRSLINSRLEKVKNLDQEVARHWNQIYNGTYDFERMQKDAANIKLLTKQEMLAFYAHYIDPKSQDRAKVVVHLLAQAKSDVSTREISELVKTLSLNSEQATKAATDLQARLTSAHHDHKKELEELKEYLTKDLAVAEEAKIEAAVSAWEKLSKEHRTNGNGVSGDKVMAAEDVQLSYNGTTAVIVDDVYDFKLNMKATGGVRPVKDLSEYEDFEPKL